jgi:hypothetical protein
MRAAFLGARKAVAKGEELGTMLLVLLCAGPWLPFAVLFERLLTSQFVPRRAAGQRNGKFGLDAGLVLSSSKAR